MTLAVPLLLLLLLLLSLLSLLLQSSSCGSGGALSAPRLRWTRAQPGLLMPKLDQTPSRLAVYKLRGVLDLMDW